MLEHARGGAVVIDVDISFGTRVIYFNEIFFSPSEIFQHYFLVFASYLKRIYRPSRLYHPHYNLASTYRMFKLFGIWF